MGYISNILRRLMRYANHRDPMTETAQAASHRQRHLERSAGAVSRKITKLYGANPDLAPDMAGICEMASTRMTDQWMNYPRNAKLLNDPAVDSELVRAAIFESAQNYMQLFMQRTRLRRLPEQPTTPYDTLTAREILHAIHANHTSNIAEARLIAAGVNAIDAHRINGFIVHQCLDFMHDELHMSAGILPIQQSPKSDLQAIHQVERLRSYWRSRVTELNGVLNGHAHYDRA